MKRDWWKGFFTPSVYPIEELTDSRSTRAEVLELRRRLRLPRGARVLDLCCGAGRHSLPLARAGLRVTGLDQSRPYLARARSKASRLPKALRPLFVHGDMRKLPFEGEFDAVVNLWTSFGYFPDVEDDRRALRGVLKALKPGGVLALELFDAGFRRRDFLAQTWHRFPAFYLLEGRRLRKGGDPAILGEFVFLRLGGRLPTAGGGGTSSRERSVGRVHGGEVFTRMYDRARLARELRRAGFARVRLLGGLLEPRAPVGRRRRIFALAYKRTA
ncbi:MAG: class I SAM-dependent methyltransferase [Elusimicrobiota bacterium]